MQNNITTCATYISVHAVSNRTPHNDNNCRPSHRLVQRCMIDAADITFVIQGIYDPALPHSVAAIRQYFAGAKVIFSCCGDAPTVPCVDQVITSPDPGFFYYVKDDNSKANNVNRQIVNTFAGLNAVDTPYAFKMRSDFVLTGNTFVDFFSQYAQQNQDYAVFAQRILACCYFSRNPNVKPFPFHPSDLAFFGKTADLQKLFNIPLMTEQEAYWSQNPRRLNRYTPEQYIFIQALRQQGKHIACDYFNDISPDIITQSEQYMVNNFMLLSFEQFNLSTTKSTFNIQVHPNAFASCYTHVDWLKLYQQYLDPTIILPAQDTERVAITKAYRNYGKYRFLANALAFPFFRKNHKRFIRNKVLEYFLHD